MHFDILVVVSIIHVDEKQNLATFQQSNNIFAKSLIRMNSNKSECEIKQRKWTIKICRFRINVSRINLSRFSISKITRLNNIEKKTLIKVRRASEFDDNLWEFESLKITWKENQFID